jgi:uncharacterized protein with HEPN domain
MNSEVQKFLYDIQVSIDSIENYLGDKRDFKVYKANKMLRRAIEREFEIIGEALNCIDKIDESLEISGKRLIIGMRNRVIHNYDRIDDEIVWGTILRHLPVLKDEITKLIE